MNDEIKEIQESVRSFCAKEAVPKRQAMDENPALCKTLLAKLGELGFLAPTLPEQYGGIGMAHKDAVVIFEEIIRGNPSLGLSAGAHAILTAHAIETYGSPAQKFKYLKTMASGEHIGAWAVTEPSGGSDIRSMQSFAKPQGNGFVLNGSKTFINAPIADVVVIYVKDGGPDADKFSGFILERGMKGLSLSKPMHKFGMEGSPTGDVFMEGDGDRRKKRLWIR